MNRRRTADDLMEALEAEGPAAISNGEKTLDAQRLERVRAGATRRVEARRRPRTNRVPRVALYALAAALVVGAALAAAMLAGAFSSRPPSPAAAAQPAPVVQAQPAQMSVTPPAVSVDDLPAASSPKIVSATPAGPSATELFAQANAARQAGNLRGAAATYQQLERAFPASDEAAVARVSRGRILLDQGDAAAALREFDAYLADKGHTALREDSLVGRARALGGLGRRDDERAAWQALLDQYPASLYSGRARARIDELR